MTNIETNCPCNTCATPNCACAAKSCQTACACGARCRCGDSCHCTKGCGCGETKSR
jgi:hypothetical protein